MSSRSISHMMRKRQALLLQVQKKNHKFDNLLYHVKEIMGIIVVGGIWQAMKSWPFEYGPNLTMILTGNRIGRP